METLSAVLADLMDRAQIGSQRLSKLTGLPRTSIDNWRSGMVRRPNQWQPLLQVARALALPQAEADALLAAAGYPSLATLIRDLAEDHPDREYLRPWLEAASTAIHSSIVQRAQALESHLKASIPPPAQRCHQLRAPAADFVGRADAIATLTTTLRAAADNGAVAAISGVRGMGGIGKTELAYLVATRLGDAFPDAQIVIDLRGAGAAPLPAEQALQQVIQLFVPDEKLPTDLPTLQQRYRSVLYNRRALILADDAYDAAHVRPLLPPPGCALLITSRQRFTLPGMTAVDLEQLDEDEAVALLRRMCERLSVADAQVIARACGYLPLALRVSGGLVRNDSALPVADYIQQLTAAGRLAQLRDPDDAQLDVAASLALSYARLEAPTQSVFRRLGVFVADFSTSMALAVVLPPAGVELGTTLRLLLRRNMVMYDTGRERWRLHDLVCDLALHQLEAAGEADAARRRYARAAIQLAQAAQDQYLDGGEGVRLGLACFDAELPHIDAARAWATARVGTREGDALLVADALATYQISDLRYNLRDVRIPQMERALAAARRLDDRRGEGLILSNLGRSYLALGASRRAIPYFEQSLTIMREIGDQHGEAGLTNNLAGAYRRLGDLRQAIPYFEQALASARAIRDRRVEGYTLGNLGGAYLDLKNPRRAISYLEQSLPIIQSVGDQRFEGIILSSLGIAYVDLRQPEQAIPYFEQALVIRQAMSDRWREGYTLTHLGRAYALLDDVKLATKSFEQAIALFREFGDRQGEAECSRHFGCFLAHQGSGSAPWRSYAPASPTRRRSSTPPPLNMHPCSRGWRQGKCRWNVRSSQVAGRSARQNLTPPGRHPILAPQRSRSAHCPGPSWHVPQRTPMHPLDPGAFRHALCYSRADGWSRSNPG